MYSLSLTEYKQKKPHLVKFLGIEIKKQPKEEKVENTKVSNAFVMVKC